MRPHLPLLALLALAGCSTRSRVVELEPGLYALTTQSQTPATAARMGVERARAWCTARQATFEPIRSEIGNADYQIAFRCPRPVDPQALEVVPPAGATLPEIPGFRQEPGLL